MSTMNKNLYSKNILVRMINSKPTEERLRSIHITVDYQMINIPSHKTELIIKLTDEIDPSFLYTLHLSEDDYQSLKTSQALLVDFNSFGQRLIDLLQTCEKDEKSSNPKFQLCFMSREPFANATLEVVEINPFKHLCHLSLCFNPANDGDIKKHLGTCIMKLRDEHARTVANYEEIKSQLTLKLESAQQELTQRANEIARLRSEFEAATERQTAKYTKELEFEKQRWQQSEFAMQQRYDKERKELETSAAKQTSALQARLQELELENKELTERRYKTETHTGELSYRNEQMQRDLDALKAELGQFKKENATLDAKVFSSANEITMLSSRLGQVEAELKEKQSLLNKAQDRLLDEQNNRRILDDTLKSLQLDLNQKQLKISHYESEFEKGTEAINKLQEKENKLINQVKIKTKVMTEQEAKIKAFNKDIEQMSNEIQLLKKELGLVKEQNSQLNTTLQAKTNEINELNHKLSQKDSSGGGGGGAGSDAVNSNALNTAATSSSSFRPYGTLLSTNNHFINSNLSPSPSLLNNHNHHHAKVSASTAAQLAHMNLGDIDLTTPNSTAAVVNPRLSAPAAGTAAGGGGVKNHLLTSSSTSSLHHHHHHMHQDHSKENLEINPQLLSSRGGVESLKLGSTGSNASSTAATSSTSNKLDPKYFQNPQAANALRSGSSASNAGNGFDLQKKLSPTSSSSQQTQQQQQQQHGSNRAPPAATTTNPVGLVAAKPLDKVTPPIASSYFPH